MGITAHQAALKHGLPTVAVAHGLDRLYPGVHAATAAVHAGAGWAGGRTTQQPLRARQLPPQPGDVALSDCTIVVESGPRAAT